MVDCANSCRNTIQNLYSSAQTFRMMMRIAHDHRDCLPSSKLLHGVDVHAGLHKSSREGMAQIMEPKASDAGLP
jgi:hypothetical protein